MSPEAALLLVKARRLLDQARSILDIGINEQAGRIAYAAAFNAAQALIFERGARRAKTHRGVKARFNELTRNEPGIGADLREFLESGFELKQLADYFQPGDREVTLAEATNAVAIASQLIAAVTQALPPEAG